MGYQPFDAKEGFLAQPLTERQDLYHYFEEGYKKPNEVRIGMEVEKHGIFRTNFKPVHYFGKSGLRQIQEKLIEELDWKVDYREGRYIVSMGRGGTKLTLESSQSMSELAGRTHPSIHDLARELRFHQHEISEISRLFNIVWLGIGFEPFASNKDLKLVRVRRFEISSKKETGKVTPGLWDRIASVQANIDYVSAEDAIRKFQILLRLSPFLSAMYAHSPMKEGKTTGYVSYRSHIFRQGDPDRMGIRKFFFKPDLGLDEWIDFCLKTPVRAIFREGKWLPVSGMDFSHFLKKGWENYAPKMEDWVLHLSFIYTDVRIRQYIELRVCDSLPPSLIPSMQGIVKGFVYHKDGLKLLEDLTSNWTYNDFLSCMQPIAKEGMEAVVKGKKLLQYCKEVVNIASEHLHSFQVVDEKGRDESALLEPIKEFVFVKEQSPGRMVADLWDGEWRKNPEKLIEWCSFE